MPKKVEKTKNIDDDNLLERPIALTSELEKKLKESPMEVQLYVTALKSENLKLQKQIAKYQAQEVTLKNSIKLAKDDLDEENAKRTVGGVIGLIMGKTKPLVSEG